MMEAVKKIKLTTLPGDAGRIHPSQLSLLEVVKHLTSASRRIASDLDELRKKEADWQKLRAAEEKKQ